MDNAKNTENIEVYTQYLRCYTEKMAKPPKKKARQQKKQITTKRPKHPIDPMGKLVNHIGAPYHGWVFVFDVETTITIDQSFKVGAYAVYGLSNQDKVLLASLNRLDREALDTLHETGLFYDGKMLSQDDIKIIQDYAQNKKLPLYTKDEFVKKVFYYWVYKYQALCIGHNLKFDISRLSTNWTEARDFYRGGFSFRLCECNLTDGYNHCDFHPSIRVKKLGGSKAMFGFAGVVKYINGAPVKSESTYRGKFLDTKTFGLALLGGGKGSLLEMGKRFKADIVKSQVDGHGVISYEYLDYNINDVHATFALYKKQRDLYKLHGVSQEPWKIYSEASLGKAYLNDLGFPKFMKQHSTFPKEALGIFMSTYYGGRSEVKLRRQVSECIYVDFKSQYPTVNALQGLQELLLSESITIESKPKELKEWIDGITLEDLQQQSTWKRLRGICKVIPDNDILPVRTNYNDNSPAANIGVNYLSSTIPTWYTIADAIASKLLTGKTPNIIDSMALIPHGRMETKPFNLFDDEAYRIDLGKDDLFTSVIDLRAKVQHDRNKCPKDSEEYQFLDGLQMALKLLANSTSYGVLVEVQPDEHDTPQKGIVCADRVFNIEALALETPGAYFAGAVGTLIPAGGRLLLAIAERLGLDRGIRMAMNDTDSAIYAKPEKMKREAFRKCVEEITAFFNPLSPYKMGGALFEMEDCNYSEKGELESLYFFGVSTKRYAVFNQLDDGGIVIRAFKEHGLGHIEAPTDYKTPFAESIADGRQFVHDIWMKELLMAVKNEYITLPLNTPLLESCTVSTSAIYDMYKNIPHIRPFSFFTAFPTIDAANNYGQMLNGSTMYAPKINGVSELMVKLYRRDTNELIEIPRDMLTTINTGIIGYFTHEEAKSMPSNGTGWLERRHVKVIEQVYIGKEYSQRHEAAMQVKDLSKHHPTPLPILGVFADSPMKYSLIGVSMTQLADITGLDYDYLKQLKAGKHEPRQDLRDKILNGVRLLQLGAYVKPKTGVSLRDVLTRAIEHMQPLTISKFAKVGLKTIYRILNGELVKASTANRIIAAIEEIDSNAKSFLLTPIER